MNTDELKIQMEFILGATKTGLDIIDSEFNIRYIDPEWQKVYGDFKGKKCYEYFMGKKAVCPGCGILETLKTKKPLVAERILTRENNRPIQVTTIPFQNIDGEWLVAEVNVDISQRKKIEEELQKYRDHLEELVKKRTNALELVIRERKKIEEALRESETKYRTLIESMPAATYIGAADDPSAKFYISPQIEQILGFPRSEIDTSAGWGKLVHPDDFENVSKDLEKCKKHHVAFNAEYRIRTRDGRFIWVHDSAMAVQYKLDGPFFLQGVLVDITKRKEAEGVLRRDKENFENLVNERTKELLKIQMELEKAKRLSDIGSLAATVAHELRNPLAAIRIAAFNVRKKSQDSSLISHLDNIEEKILESNQIINNLLFYSRIKKPLYEKTNIYEIINECIDSARIHFPEKNILVSSNIENLNKLPCDLDPLQMRELFRNILINAFEALEAEKGKVLIKSEVIKEKGKIIIFIIDNGVGIDSKDMDSLFEPFFTTKAKGIGLGLVVCQQIVKLHEGSLNLESKKGKGTTVTVILPINRRTP